MAAILAVPTGLILGSFATVVAHRVPRGESIVTGRSRCPSCGATIAAYDNVPVLSWLMLRGRCRGCGERISPRYPLTELAMAALFAATVLILGTDDVGELALGLALCAVLVTVTITDLERRVIPNAVLLVGALVGAGIAAASDPGSLPERAVAAAGAGGFLFCVALAYPRGMGMGDVKLVAVMGLYLGRAVAPALLDRLRRWGPRGARDDRPTGGHGAQAGHPFRALPGARRDRRAVVRRRDRRLVPGHLLPRLTARPVP